MKRENLLNTVGLTLLLACFLFAFVRVLGVGGARKDDAREVLRFSHWQLEGGLRDAFDQLCRTYEKLHPGVRVEQLAIPERTYAQWIKTQLIGGTAPDIIQLGKGNDVETVARFFVPISEAVNRPNPYNAGTPLADTPWRDTILDGMSAPPSYYSELVEHYGAPVSMFTIRMYYNRDLWRRVLGDTPVPRDHDAFHALFPLIEEFNRRSGRSILPIAGSRANAPMLIGALVQNQTQRLVQEKIAGPTLRFAETDVGLRLLRGDWTLDDPAYTDALAIARETALRMQPGFSQLGREDATFYFVQGNALMITTGSWDSPSFLTQVGFDLGVFDIPLPARDHPRYGKNLYGRSSEAEVGTGLAFGITRQSPNSARALDFLHFLSSVPYNAEFSRLSGWLPSVVGVVPPEQIRPFLPVDEGYVPGFGLDFNTLGANSQRTMGTNLNTLYAPHGSVDEFRAAIAAELPKAVASDLDRFNRNILVNLTRQDAAILAYLSLSRLDPSDPSHPAKLDQILESQNSLEANRAWFVSELDRLGTSPATAD